MNEVKNNFENKIQLVIFLVDKGEYGLEINQVQEINRLLPITRVPRGPDYVEGVVNLRGNVIPVVNLHHRLGLGARVDSERTRIIIVQTKEILAGLVVDGVLEVLDLPPKAIEPPVMTEITNVVYLQGIGKIAERLILLLDLNKLLNLEELGEQAS